jgi:hypothetical protein
MNFLGVRWRRDYLPTSTENIFIIESKYMDYSLLSSLVLEKVNTSSKYIVPIYFEHPWDLKRNMEWPVKLEKKVINAYPVEKYLSQYINCNSHVLTGMTSVVVFISELVKLGLMPKHRVTLLLSSDFEAGDFINNSEASDFCFFMRTNFGEFLDLHIFLNGLNVCDSNRL